MNEDISQSRRCGPPRRAALLAAAAGIALLAAACGGNPSADGSGSPSTGPGGSSAAGRPTAQQKQLTWSECMRSHGENVPAAMPSPVPGGTAQPVKLDGPVVNPNSPQYQAAQQACRSLQPGGTRVAG